MTSTAVLREAASGLLLCASMLWAADFPNPIVDNKDAGAGKQTAVLSGGCFWCVEVVYQQIAGVEKVISGYSGGDASTAHYDMVGMGTTGNAETVQETYDPSTVSYVRTL